MFLRYLVRIIVLLLFTGPIDFTRDVVTYLLVVGTVVAVAFDGSVCYL